MPAEELRFEHHPFQRIGPDAHLIQDVQFALGRPLCVPINSAVLTGQEPVIIDTGSPRNRQQWLDDVFSIVEPEDVRWVFVSHEDADHTGNLETVMARCPNATLLCSWALVERFSCVYDFPLHRCRWVADGGPAPLCRQCHHAPEARPERRSHRPQPLHPRQSRRRSLRNPRLTG
ncbi:MBL fold metallo-hydrolase [Streptomyces sp. NPDC059426]|uniref:MBL fold metallo-hydrolase n=1 Tax=unclassified Streptomyces TaxID=2593676 RepID=UPI0036995FA9